MNEVECVKGWLLKLYTVCGNLCECTSLEFKVGSDKMYNQASRSIANILALQHVCTNLSIDLCVFAL